MSLTTHNDMIREITKNILKPAGIKQRGQSRLWYDDCGWFASLIEFQPYSRGKGTFLNLGINWFWNPNTHWTFHIFFRATKFVEFEDETSFRNSVTSLANQSVGFVTKMRAELMTSSAALNYATGKKTDKWALLNQGVLAALSGQNELALKLLNNSIVKDSKITWEQNRNAFAQSMIDCIISKNDIRHIIEPRIKESRSQLKLRTIESNVLP